VTLLVLEPTAIEPRPAIATLIAALLVLEIWLTGREPCLADAARALRRLEPFADAARLGPVAMLIVHGIIARAERPSRRAQLAPAILLASPAACRPVILVQCESFFDARRILPLPPGFLAGYDRSGETFGRLD